jgi:hypothetical protein
MNISMDKKYTYTNGKSARILCVDCPNTEFPVISMDQCGQIHYHTANGRNEWTTISLIEVWQPQDKELVWAWDYTDTVSRRLSFYDKINNSLFTNNGLRNGHTYDNYAKVKHIEQWMLDAQAELQD